MDEACSYTNSLRVIHNSAMPSPCPLLGTKTSADAPRALTKTNFINYIFRHMGIYVLIS